MRLTAVEARGCGFWSIAKRFWMGLFFLTSFFGGRSLAETKILVVHKWADSVGVYSCDTGLQLATVAVGTCPHESVLSPDGTLAYITEYGVRSYTDRAEGGNRISIVDLKSLSRIGLIDLGKYHRPHGIVVGRSGRLYVTADFPPALLVVDPATKRIVKDWILDQSLPHMVAVQPDETAAYTANSGSGTVSIIDLEAGKVLKHVQIGGIPMGFALGADGRLLYSANRTGNAVAVIDTRTNCVVRFIEIEGQPARLKLVQQDRYLLASLHEAGDVAVIDTNNFNIVHRFHAGAIVEGLNTDEKLGLGFVSAQGDDKVVQFQLESWKVLSEIHTDSRPDPIQILP